MSQPQALEVRVGRPAFSVIIPAFNSTTTLPAQLRALAGQDFDEPWEILIADNGSSDDLQGCVARCTAELMGLPECQVIDSSRVAGAGYARTIALLHAGAERIAFCDADDVVSPSWLRALARGLDDADVVTGAVSDVTTTVLDQRGPDELFDSLHFEVGQNPGGVWGCNSAFRREALSGFSPDLIYKKDNATGLRALSAGHRWARVEEARVLYRQPERPTTQFHRGYLNGAGRVQLYREFPEIGYLLTRPLRSLLWLILHAPSIVLPTRRIAWTRTAGSYVGSVVETVLPGLSGGVLTARRARRARRGG
jgi:glycosyltransferase involved in cell wall biosynthesis